MNFVLYFKIWVFAARKRLRREKTPFQSAKAHFATQYASIVNACMLLESAAKMPPDRLARNYMRRVLDDETDEEWWFMHVGDLTQAWFIWEYGCAKGLISPPQPETPRSPVPILIRPESDFHKPYAFIRLEREPTQPEMGLLRVSASSPDADLPELLRKKNFRGQTGEWFRKIGEHAAPVLDRAAETAVLLLEHGYPVSVDEPALKEMILHRRYQAEYLFWVLAPPNANLLWLKYPHDNTLNRYVSMAGGKWNGRCMEISICAADKIEEIQSLYDFRITKEAQHRLDVWNEAVRQTTIYRSRSQKEQSVPEATADRFQKLLNRRAEILEDLRDTNV